MVERAKHGSIGRLPHTQQALFRHGGARKGAGRKPKGTRAGTTHEARPLIKASNPLHVVLRVVPEVGSLRRKRMYKAVRDSSIVAAIRGRIRIIHISIQATHIHLLIEAESKLALARGMQGFQISLARNINTVLGGDKPRRRRGRVFADRYHLVVISSPTQARNALSYVLGNWRKHHEDRGDGRAAGFDGLPRGPSRWLVDPYSSGCSFADWYELRDKRWMWKLPAGYDPLIVYRPRSWLLRTGWKCTGAISARDIPGTGQRPIDEVPMRRPGGAGDCARREIDRKIAATAGASEVARQLQMPLL